MAISGIDGMSVEDLKNELRNGGRFVVYMYCVSLLIVTFKRSSDIHFVKSGEKDWKSVAMYSLITLLLGWWGIPWGPIYSFTSLFDNLRGGKDVTDKVLQSMAQQPSAY